MKRLGDGPGDLQPDVLCPTLDLRDVGLAYVGGSRKPGLRKARCFSECAYGVHRTSDILCIVEMQPLSRLA